MHTNNTTTVLVASPAYPSAASAYPSNGGGDGSAASDLSRRAPDAQRAASVLHELMLLDGLIFAVLVDINSGQVVASEGRGPDIDRAAWVEDRREVHRSGAPNDFDYAFVSLRRLRSA